MQVTRPNEEVRLHPKAGAALGIQAGTSEPQYQEHACMPWERDTPGSPVNP